MNVSIMWSCTVKFVWILLFLVFFVSMSALLLFIDRILTFGIPSIGLVGRLGHFNDHGTCSVEPHAPHFGGRLVLQSWSLCSSLHLVHLIGEVQSSVLWVNWEHLLQGIGSGSGGWLGFAL